MCDTVGSTAVKIVKRLECFVNIYIIIWWICVDTHAVSGVIYERVDTRRVFACKPSEETTAAWIKHSTTLQQQQQQAVRSRNKVTVTLLLTIYTMASCCMQRPEMKDVTIGNVFSSVLILWRCALENTTFVAPPALAGLWRVCSLGR